MEGRVLYANHFFYSLGVLASRILRDQPLFLPVHSPLWIVILDSVSS